MSYDYYPYPDDSTPEVMGLGPLQQPPELERPPLQLPDLSKEALLANVGLIVEGEAAIKSETPQFLQWYNRFLNDGMQPLRDDREVLQMPNVAKSPFDALFMYNYHLRRRGYGIYLTDGAVDEETGLSAPNELRVYVDEDDMPVLDAIEEIDMADGFSHAGINDLLSVAANGVYSTGMSHYYLKDAPDYSGAPVRESMHTALKDSGVKDPEYLIARSFMTSQVLAATEEQAQPLSRVDNPSPEAAYFDQRMIPRNRLLYAVLGRQGVRPFSVDHLYGMASGVVDSILRDNPDIPGPANPPIRRRLS